MELIKAGPMKGGAHIATVPYDALLKSTKHPLTDKGIDTFLKDWGKFTKEQG